MRKKLVAAVIVLVVSFLSTSLSVSASEYAYTRKGEKIPILSSKTISFAIPPIDFRSRPHWTYTEEKESNVLYSNEESIEHELWVSYYLPQFEPHNGESYFASGYLYHYGTINNFELGKKLALYRGTISALIYY